MRCPCGAFTVAAMAYLRRVPRHRGGIRLKKKRRPVPRRPSPRRAPRTGRPRAARARPRCGPSRAPRTRASGAGSAASAGMAPASCPSSHQYAIAATVVRVLSFIPPRRHRRDGRAHRGRGRLALIELLNGGALAASLAALAVEEEPQLKPAEHAVAHYGAGALFADPRCPGGVLARLRVASMASTARRLSLRSTTERVSRTCRSAATRLDSPRRTVRDHAHATAALPQATTTAGAPSARARRWRRSRPPASSSGSGTRVRPSSGSTPSLRRPRLLPSRSTTTRTTPTQWRPVWKSIRVDGVNFAVHTGGVGPVARRRPRRGLGPLGAHAADVVASHRSRRPRGSLAVAPSRPGVLSFFRGGVPVTERSQGRGLGRGFCLRRPVLLPDKYAIAATVILTQGPSPRCGARARGPRARSRSTVLCGVCFFQQPAFL